MNVLTRNQAADLLQIPVRTLDYWVATCQIPFSRLGKRMVRFDRDRLEEWFRSRELVEYRKGGGVP